MIFFQPSSNLCLAKCESSGKLARPVCVSLSRVLFPSSNISKVTSEQPGYPIGKRGFYLHQRHRPSALLHAKKRRLQRTGVLAEFLRSFLDNEIEKTRKLVKQQKIMTKTLQLPDHLGTILLLKLKSEISDGPISIRRRIAFFIYSLYEKYRVIP
jgi:hypothetical protein